MHDCDCPYAVKTAVISARLSIITIPGILALATLVRGLCQRLGAGFLWAKKKLASHEMSLLLRKLARSRRFERLTPSLGGKCSIQLSYGDTRLILIHSPASRKHALAPISSPSEHKKKRRSSKKSNASSLDYKLKKLARVPLRLKDAFSTKILSG